ncbi:MAG: GtrA family protein [Leptospiraceae bacterium]|nr:GtrA family protein [Leptospiraceae bacterium]
MNFPGRDLRIKIIKFLIVGGIGTAINYGFFLVLFRYFHFHYLFASVSGYLFGLAIAYLFNKHWTYSNESASSDSVFIHKYLMVYLSSLLISTLSLKLMVESFGMNELIANVFAISLATVLNFLGTNFLVFKK